MGPRFRTAVLQMALAQFLAIPVFMLAMGMEGASTPLAVAIWWTIGLLIAPLVLAARASIAGHPCPDMSKQGWMLVGPGCVLCHHVRGWLPVALAPFGAAVSLYADSWLWLGAGLLAATFHLVSGWQALRANSTPYWTRAAGFSAVKQA